VTLGGIVELRKPQTVLREGVESGRFDLRAIATEIRESQVVRHDENDVGTLGGVNRGHSGTQGEDDGCGAFHERAGNTGRIGPPLHVDFARWVAGFRLGGYSLPQQDPPPAFTDQSPFWVLASR
jgi:hypothetical protein